MNKINAKRVCLSASLVLVMLIVAHRAEGQQRPPFHTRSIVACDPLTRECGVGVVSFPTGVPAVVPVGEPGVIVANQGTPSLANMCLGITLDLAIV